jgi:hypothetical protein
LISTARVLSFFGHVPSKKRLSLSTLRNCATFHSQSRKEAQNKKLPFVKENVMNRKLTGLMLLITSMLLVTGCVGRLNVGSTQTESQTVELGDAESARVDINMGVGKVRVQGGANDLLEADFTYNVDDWKPEVDYSVSNGNGRLTIQQPDSNFEGIPDDEIEYEWDLNLNEDVPMNLDINLGVGDSNLDLSGLSLSDLDVEIGVGKATIDLTGDWDQSFDADIRGGVGSTTLLLPRNVGVRVETNTGIGSIDVHGLIRNGDTYTNEAYEGADVVIDITVHGGVGQIELELGD